MNEQIKPYTLTLEDRREYLYAHIKAETMTAGLALSYTREIADECSRLGRDRVLLERDVPSMMSAGDLFFTTEEFVRMMTGKRVALINPYLDNKEGLDLAVMIGNNRGAQFRLLPTVEAAEQWLLHISAE